MNREMAGNNENVEKFVEGIDFSKGEGLVPVVVQDQKTKDVLMLAYANKEALHLSFTTGVAHYWSRSRSDKVSINTGAVKNPALVSELAENKKD